MQENALEAAAEAVRREARESTLPKRLRCHAVHAVDSESNLIYRFDVGTRVQFDWSWEGSRAYQPTVLNELGPLPDVEIEKRWSGDIVEVDPDRGRIYIAIEQSTVDPLLATGTFFVVPFPFLRPLRDIYQEVDFQCYRRHLPRRLELARSGAGSRLPETSYHGTPGLEAIWQHDWSILWGPPGTGKTYTIGEQVAELLQRGDERILVISTTNRATDEAALAIGDALVRRGILRDLLPAVIRVGKGADWQAFADRGMLPMLDGSETEARRQLSELRDGLRRAATHEDRAELRLAIRALMVAIKNASMVAAKSHRYRVLVTTSYNALLMLASREMRQEIEGDRRLFHTVILDEAGLISRAAAAPLSLMGGTRTVLVGDPRQLAPISVLARVLAPKRAVWLARSGLSCVGDSLARRPAVHMLSRQYRMHPDICHAVSHYQYDGRLDTAQEVEARAPLGDDGDPLLANCPRAIWYVLDEDARDLASLRADRGPGNRSWIRPYSLGVLSTLFRASSTLREGDGLFLSPFTAQAAAAAKQFSESAMEGWRASTVHAQQGAEAKFVIFDTVNAGSHAWPTDEWKRLVNVGISRARELVILLASRQEMAEPYLQELRSLVKPRVLEWRGSRYFWRDLGEAPSRSEPGALDPDPETLGGQIAARKRQRPVLSHDQERLSNLVMDGGPRLVRGVAGSGKTVILAHWLAQTLERVRGEEDVRVWVVYANKSLRHLVETTALDAWCARCPGIEFPWERVEVLHVRQVLDSLYGREGLGAADYVYDFELGARRIMGSLDAQTAEYTCDALFVDEAQDLGHDTLKLLVSLIRPSDAHDASSRAAIFFYDNAQNLYGRGMPRWADFGLDMRGRSTVLKESFRSTRPIAEFALNVLYRLCPPGADPEHRELVERGLIEETQRNQRPWWRVHFNEIQGPQPVFRRFASLDEEIAGLCERVCSLLSDEAVQPCDVAVIYNGRNIRTRLERELPRVLTPLGFRALVQTSEAFTGDEHTVVVTTPHSFKGYDAEVVLVAAAEQFNARETGILSETLYVAMTRARSVLEVFGQNRTGRGHGAEILNALEDCADDSLSASTTAFDSDDLELLVTQLGEDHRAWLTRLKRHHDLGLEPIRGELGAIVAQPVFSYTAAGRTVACFAETPRPAIAALLQDAGVRVILPGEASD